MNWIWGTDDLCVVGEEGKIICESKKVIRDTILTETLKTFLPFFLNVNTSLQPGDYSHVLENQIYSNQPYDFIQAAIHTHRDTHTQRNTYTLHKLFYFSSPTQNSIYFPRYSSNFMLYMKISQALCISWFSHTSQFLEHT